MKSIGTCLFWIVFAGANPTPSGHLYGLGESGFANPITVGGGLSSSGTNPNAATFHSPTYGHFVAPINTAAKFQFGKMSGMS